MTTKRIWALAAVLLLLTAACGSSSSDSGSSEEESTAESSATTAAAPATTAAPEPEPTSTTTPPSTTTTTEIAATGGLPDTPATASFNQAYTFQQGIPDPDKLPAQAGTVEARWYRTPGGFAVVYVGLDADVDACPGNSALTAGGFQFVSNAPLPNGVCDDFPTRVDNTDTQGVKICDGLVGYLTLIPSDTVGTFFASIEKPDPDVVGVGLTSSVDIADPSAVPEIDPAALSC